VVRKAYKLYQLGGVVSEILYSPAAYGLDMSVKNMPKPRARISPQVGCLKCAVRIVGTEAPCECLQESGACVVRG
jgi:hypothetical protein